MVNVLRVSYNWMRMAWARQPILVVSCALGVIGEAMEDRRKLGGVLYLEQYICRPTFCAIWTRHGERSGGETELANSLQKK